MIKRHSTENIFGIDAFRGLSIILMFITHGSRIYNGSGDNGILNSLLHFFSIIEPFTSASFLFLVGVGLNLSFSKNKLSYSSWLKSNTIKAAQLYLIGLLFFFMEYGVQIPEMFFGPSILSIIALAIISLSLCITSPFFLLWGSILIGAISLSCEGTAVQGINTGPGGVFPLVLFSFLGYFGYEFIKTKNKSGWGLIGLGIVSSFYPHLPTEHWTQTYPSIYDHFLSGQTGFDYIQSMGSIHGYTKVGFWNHTLVSVFRLFIPLILILGLVIKYSNQIKNNLFGPIFGRLGRHALGLYLLHLTIIAVCDFSGLRPASALWDWAFIGFLILIGNYYARYQDQK